MLFLLIILVVVNIAYLYIYNKKVLDFIYNNKENKREEIVYEDFFKFKAGSYVLYIIPLLLAVILSRYIRLDAWLIIYYGIWILGFAYIYINLKMLNHILDIIFVRDVIKKIERDFLIGTIKRRGAVYIFKHRLLGDILKL